MTLSIVRKSPLCAAPLLLLACLLLLQTGCSGGNVDDPRNMGVSGKVSYNGQPVPFGQILFSPDSSAGNSGPQGIAEIRNGAYNTAASGGKGTVGGPHVVRISGFAADPATGNEDNPVAALFPDYETKVDLPKGASTQDFEVPGDGKTQKADAPAQEGT